MKAPVISERKIQRANMDLIIAIGFQAAHVPNGMNLSGDKLARAKQMSVLRADGLRPGFPDLVVIGRFPMKSRLGTELFAAAPVGFIECKRSDIHDLDDPDQIWWRDEIRRRGLPCGFVNTPDGAHAVLRQWGWI